ncbi:MAG: YafY family transcriptional regulator [Acidipropionibacterium acidipropionici]|nr:YafY family transcriptional regulator [Acidipropionibacterium acidipropionici]
MSTQTPRERMLRLLSLLQTGRQWPAADLADATGATPRTLRRDIDFLRELGYPVRSARGPGGHYQLVAGRALPPLMLEDDEAVATVLGLRLAAAADVGGGSTAEAAERAADKLRRMLPPRLRRTTDGLMGAVEISATASVLPAPTLLATLARAVSQTTRVSFTYQSRSGTARRDVEPARLIQLRQRWYLFAWDRDRHDWRTFRLDRFHSDPQAGGPFTPRPLPAGDLPAYLRERFVGAPELTVVLTLHADASQAASRLYRIDGTLEPLDDGSCRYVAHVDSYEWLTVALTLSDVDFTVESPDAYRAFLAERAARLAAGCTATTAP